MNITWSKYVQGINTLYYSRKLRFDDMFAPQYEPLFALDKDKPLKILEIGCGPGALAGALHRWYPQAQITAIDRDSEFIRFAKKNESGITFLEGDATALPFDDNTFDVTISNTVSEHIEPSAFYSEQRRVLKPSGICLVLSSRRGLHSSAPCLSPTEYEKQFWKTLEPFDDSMTKYAVCQYPMSEAELPAAMEKYGFDHVLTGFVVADLTPDHPKFSSELAHDIINAGRCTALDAVDSALYSMPEHVTQQAANEMKGLINARYDQRIAQYDHGDKQWDTSVSIIMVVRGQK
ncbi:MAG: class I SAM-dependent methyltransferase [Firmicutes bacterium]|nr:class I SAM-dependent methyltransferase [Bacillota bacterium]